MKILIVTGIYPPEIGGPATVMESLVGELRSHQDDVHVITYSEGVSDETVTRVSRMGGIPERYLRMSNAIRSALQRMGPETILLATDVFSVGIPTRIALSGQLHRFAVRLGGEWAWEDAVTKRGLRVTLREYWKDHANGFTHHLKTRIAKFVLKRANQIIVTSDLLREVLQRLDPTFLEKTTTVPNVPTVHHASAYRVASSPDLRVLYSGRFAPVKNVPFFARVLKKALGQGAQISMTFVGDGEERKICEEILQGEASVRFLGRRSSNDVAELLSETDLYVMPSLSDICPNGVIEAIGYGVPSLLTSEHGLPKELRGLLEIHPKNESAWVEALVRLASSDREAITTLRSEVRLPPVSKVTLRSVLERIPVSSPR